MNDPILTELHRLIKETDQLLETIAAKNQNASEWPEAENLTNEAATKELLQFDPLAKATKRKTNGRSNV